MTSSNIGGFLNQRRTRFDNPSWGLVGTSVVFGTLAYLRASALSAARKDSE
jgi:hypothetical protein